MTKPDTYGMNATSGRTYMLEVILVFVLSLVFYHLFLAENFSSAHDSINYLNGIVEGKNLFHPHHLLYHVTAREYFLVLSSSLISTADHVLIESYTTIWGAAGLAVAYLMFRKRFGRTVDVSIAGTSVIGLSFGYWFYSTNIEVYTPPVFFILCCIYVLSRTRLQNRDIFLLAVLHTFAILFHQVNVLFFPVVILVLFRSSAELRWNHMLRYSAISITLVLGVYAVIGLIFAGNNDFNEWVRWMRGYTHGHDYWKSLNSETPVNAAIGLSHAFVGGHFLFELPAIKAALSNSLPGHGLEDEKFLAREIGPGLAIFLAICCLFLVIAVTWLIIRFASHVRSVKSPKILMPLILTLAVYSIFFLFWMPEILEFWILQAVVFWLVLIGMVQFNRDRVARIVLYLLPALLFCVNYFGSIRWLQSFKYDLFHSKVVELKTHLGPNDIIVMRDPWILRDYFKYYTNAKVASFQYDSLNLRPDLIQTKKAGGKIFIINNGTSSTRSPVIDSLLRTGEAKQVINSADTWVIE